MTRMAISPRFATSTFENMAREGYQRARGLRAGPAVLGQPLIADPEVVRDLVPHSLADGCSQVFAAVSHQRPAVDRDHVRQHATVARAALRLRDALVQPEQRPLRLF